MDHRVFKREYMINSGMDHRVFKREYMINSGMDHRVFKREYMINSGMDHRVFKREYTIFCMHINTRGISICILWLIRRTFVDRVCTEFDPGELREGREQNV